MLLKIQNLFLKEAVLFTLAVCNYRRETARTLIQGTFVEAEGTRSSLVGVMPVISWVGRGVKGSPGSQDGAKGPLALPQLPSPLWLSYLCSHAANPVITHLLSIAKGLLQILVRVSLFIRD